MEKFNLVLKIGKSVKSNEKRLNKSFLLIFIQSFFYDSESKDYVTAKKQMSGPDLHVFTLFLALKNWGGFHFFGVKKKISKLFYKKVFCNFSVQTL